MIEVKTKLGKTKASVYGSLSMICADTVQIVNTIYHAIQERDADAADNYKKMMTDDLCRMAFKKDDETSEIDSIIKSLEELLKIIKD